MFEAPLIADFSDYVFSGRMMLSNTGGGISPAILAFDVISMTLPGF